MSELQEKIQEILTKRENGISKLVSQSEMIDLLRPNLQKIQKTLRDIGGGIEKSDEKLEKISEFLGQLNQASEKLRLLRKRYEKQTINIGVSGFTHAGKSTLLQAISGLGDEAIPKADEDSEESLHATTAICSQIFNAPKKYAEIVYKSDQEYLEFVNAHLNIAGLDEVASISEFQNIQIPANQDNEEEENTIKERLRLIQESIPFYKGKIGSGSDKLSDDEFNQLECYVSYSKKDKTTRFFPAVKEVKIYCPFPAINDQNVKLCLVDLPGFGEFDRVDEIQTKNLKEIVDHIIFIYKTNKDEGIGNSKYRKSFAAIKRIHPTQSTNNEFLFNLLSFVVNEDRTNSAWRNHVSQTVDTIKNNYGNYKYYSFPAIVDKINNVEEAQKNLNDILSRLADTLPKMDEILLDSLGKSMNISQITLLRRDLDADVRKYSVANDDSPIIHEKGKKFRGVLYNKIDDLQRKYNTEKEAIDGEFINQLNEIFSKTEEEIDKTLLYTQISKEQGATWEEYIDSERVNSIQASFPKELRRIWVEIINRYVKLDVDFSSHIETLKNEIATIFDEMSHIVPKREDGKFDLKLLVYDKLSILKSDNAIYKAFESLVTLSQNFRQSLYPFIFKDKLDSLMYVKGDEGGVQVLNVDNVLTIPNYKQQLTNISKNMNFEISKGIKRNFILSYFLIGALQTFKERISNIKTDTDTDFIHFCSIFRRSIYPDEYGNEADSAKIQELKALIEETQVIISKN